MKKTLFLVILLAIAGICLAQTPARPDWVSFTRTSPTSGTIRWSAEPSAYVAGYYLAYHPVMYYPPAYCDPVWNGGWHSKVNIDGGSDSAFVESPGVYAWNTPNDLNPDLTYYAYVAAVEIPGWSWNAYSSWESGEPPLPVVLSSFSATLTAGLNVQIAWTVQSETNHLGYNILRGTSSESTLAFQINSRIITHEDGNQIGTQINYQHLDQEVDAGANYYYWLESMDLGGATQYFGPISVLVVGDTDDQGIPPLPTETALLQAYPNPFNPSTLIGYTLKEAAPVKIEIFNSRGQLIRAWERDHSTAGYYNIVWDGRDSRGDLAASGMYLYRMNVGKQSFLKKMALAQ